MSFLANSFRAATLGTSDLLNPNKWVVDSFSGRRSASGEQVNEQTSLGLSAYFAGIRAIAEDCAKLPLKLFRQIDRGKEELVGGDAYRVIRRAPNEAQSPFTFRQLLTSWAVGWGSGYAEIVRTAGQGIKRLIPIHPQYVRVDFAEPENVTYTVHAAGSTPRTIVSDNMIHIMGLGKNMGEAYSVARIGIESMGLSLAAQTFGASFFGNGTALSGVITHPGVLKPSTRENLQNSLAGGFGGAQNAGKVKLLEEGMKFDKIGIPPEEAQFLQTREFQIEEVARWLRMPPHKLQHLQRSTYANIEHQSIEYVVDTLMPWLIRWEEEIQRKLIGVDNNTTFAKHVVQGLLRGDHTTRATYYQQMFMTGVLSLNEIRELEELNPIGPEGDRHYVPLNLQDVEHPPDPGMNQAPPAPPMDPGMPPDKQNPQSPPRKMPMKPDMPTPPPGRGAAQAFNLLVNDAVKRYSTRQENALSRMLKKNSAEPDLAKAWAGEFFAAEETVLIDFLDPIMRAYDRMTDTEPSPGRKKLIGAWHVQNATQEIVKSAQEQRLEPTIKQWHEVHGRPLAALALEVMIHGSNLD